jgi:hypothetical protein
MWWTPNPHEGTEEEEQVKEIQGAESEKSVVS